MPWAVKYEPSDCIQSWVGSFQFPSQCNYWVLGLSFSFCSMFHLQDSEFRFRSIFSLPCNKALCWHCMYSGKKTSSRSHPCSLRPLRIFQKVRYFPEDQCSRLLNNPRYKTGRPASCFSLVFNMHIR